MEVDGRGRFGFTRGTAEVTLHHDGPATTMSYRADLMVGGKIASVGQRLLDTVSRMLTRRGLDAVASELTRRLEALQPSEQERSGDDAGGPAA
jgi:hypothetical protein